METWNEEEEDRLEGLRMYDASLLAISMCSKLIQRLQNQTARERRT